VHQRGGDLLLVLDDEHAVRHGRSISVAGPDPDDRSARVAWSVRST
jgi:hypothetical protein